MTDESLRDLEREVREKPDDVGARLKLARALERVGRKDDALDALTPAVSDAEARREIGRLAPPVRESAGLYFDVAGIVREPQVRWERRIEDMRAGRSGHDALIANPVSIVCATDWHVTALDPRSGESRWQAVSDGAVRLRQWPTIVRDVVIAQESRELRAFDLFTGERLWTQPFEGGIVVSQASFDDPRERPSLEQLARLLPPAGVERVTVTADLRVLQEHRGADFRVLDARTGAERFRGQGFFWMSDERGLVADREDGSLASYTPAGRLEWTTSGTAYRPWALAPSFIAASSIAQDDAGRDEIRHVAIDRLTGAATELARGGPQDTVAVARDVIYIIETSTVSAYRATGERLWRLDLSSRWPRSGGWQLHPVPAPLARRLYLLVPPNGWVMCLEEPSAKLLS
jgi:outer membrane protein assembly factor BamB